ncbi:MAG: hypothetical protein AAGC60_00155 [Acidobacteriota bacterium]
MAQMPVQELTLDSLGDGAAAEIFDRMLREVIVPDLEDPSKKHNAQRSLTLKVKVSCTGEERSICAIAWNVVPRVADPAEKGSTGILHRDDRNQLVLATGTADPRQQVFDNVIALSGGRNEDA